MITSTKPSSPPEEVVAQAVPIQAPPSVFTGAPFGTASVADGAAVAKQAAYDHQYPQDKKCSSMAVASLVCAILGLILIGFGVILGPIAICLSVAAMNEIRENSNQRKGDCMAISGLIIGIIGFIISGIFVALIILGSTA